MLGVLSKWLQDCLKWASNPEAAISEQSQGRPDLRAAALNFSDVRCTSRLPRKWLEHHQSVFLCTWAKLTYSVDYYVIKKVPGLKKPPPKGYTQLVCFTEKLWSLQKAGEGHQDFKHVKIYFSKT